MPSGFEVMLSETVGQQYGGLLVAASANAESSAKLERARLLMTQIAADGSEESDHLTSPTSPLRYRSEGSTYIYYFRIVVQPFKRVYVALLCEMNVQQAGTLLLNLIETGEAAVLASLGIPVVPLAASAAARYQ
jgi:hypothetical protein